MRVEQVTGPVAYHGEGPVWAEQWGGLRWVDMLAGDILFLAADGTITRRHVGSVAAALRPRGRGGAVIGVERGFALENADGTITYLPELWADTQVRMNEGACDPDGRFYCGSMAYDQRPGAASLYRLEPDGSVRLVLDHVTVSNGLDWSPNGALAYYNDTATFHVSAFDYETDAGFINRRVFVDLSDEKKRPDGLTVDAEGGVWIALSNGSAVRRYTPHGVLDEVIEVPAKKVTACTFGGPNLDQLFITTSQENIDTKEDRLAGCLFRADVGITGLPVRPFAG
jgi:sugar lactone lactonase YvrE